MHKPIEVIKDIRKRCTHEFEPTPSRPARRCASPAMRWETFCYYHHPNHKPAVNPFPSHRQIRRARRLAYEPLALTPPTTRPEIQLCLNEVLQRLAAGRLHPRRAGHLLSALQITGSRLGTDRQLLPQNRVYNKAQNARKELKT